MYKRITDHQADRIRQDPDDTWLLFANNLIDTFGDITRRNNVMADDFRRLYAKQRTRDLDGLVAVTASSRQIQYDALNRVTNVVDVAANRRTIMTYDAVGNRTRVATFGPATIQGLTNMVIRTGKEIFVPFVVQSDVVAVTNIAVVADLYWSSRVGVTSSKPLSLRWGTGTNRYLIIPKQSPVGNATINVSTFDGFITGTNTFDIKILR